MNSEERQAMLGQILQEQAQSEKNKTKRSYKKLAPALKFAVGKHAARHGVSEAMLKYSEHQLPYSTVRNWARRYKDAGQALGRNARNAEEANLVNKGTRPPMLGQYDAMVLDLLLDLRSASNAVNKSVFEICIRSVLKTHAPHKLVENGGDIDPKSDSLRTSFWRRHGLVKRRATSTRANLTENEQQERKDEFIRSVTERVREHDIPDDLIWNVDETNLRVRPSHHYTMALRGTQNISITGRSDKRNVTGVIAINRAGQVAPPQVIYGGLTKRCLPKQGTYPPGYHATYTKKHWSTAFSKLDWAKRILVPEVKKTRRRLNLAEGEDHALLIFDHHTSNIRNPGLYKLLEENRIFYQLVPPSMTSVCQPCDQQPNAILKRELRELWTIFQTNEIINWVNAGNDVADYKVDATWTYLKHRHAAWIVAAVDKLKYHEGNPIQGAFERCGIPARKPNPNQVNEHQEADWFPDNEHSNSSQVNEHQDPAWIPDAVSDSDQKDNDDVLDDEADTEPQSTCAKCSEIIVGSLLTMVCHLRNECLQRSVQCPCCNLWHPFAELAAHTEECEGGEDDLEFEDFDDEEN